MTNVEMDAEEIPSSLEEEQRLRQAADAEIWAMLVEVSEKLVAIAQGLSTLIGLQRELNSDTERRLSHLERRVRALEP